MQRLFHFDGSKSIYFHVPDCHEAAAVTKLIRVSKFDTTQGNPLTIQQDGGGEVAPAITADFKLKSRNNPQSFTNPTNPVVDVAWVIKYQ
jgi:hypothetical protein